MEMGSQYHAQGILPPMTEIVVTFIQRLRGFQGQYGYGSEKKNSAPPGRFGQWSFSLLTAITHIL
jgi:hypothetical protein